MPRFTSGERKVMLGASLILMHSLAVTGAGPESGTRSSTQSAIAKQDNTPATVPVADGRLEIQAVAAATGKPLEGVAVEWQLRINNAKQNKTTSTTAGDGRAVLEWAKGATVNAVWVTARKPRFVPYAIRWDDSAHPLRLPASKVLRFVPGITIGGVVKDDAGNPLVDAKIKVHGPATESETSFVRFVLADTTTDAQGRWRFDDAPADLSGVNVGIQAPHFLGVWARPSRNLAFITVLNRGFTVEGRVLDARGKPISGANVSAGSVLASGPNAKTDSGGEFILEDCPPGASLVTVRAEGFAPDLREIHPEDQPALEFRLGPGHTLRGKIVDRHGKPVPGATVAAGTWRDQRSLDFRTDSRQDGRFEWRGAPGDVVLYDFFKRGFMSRRAAALSPAEAEHVITLDPELIISGRVTDAATGRPVPAFRVIRGLLLANNPGVNWLPGNGAEFTDGHYRVKHDEPYAGYAVRVVAAGYILAESRIFKPGEVDPSFDFTLTRPAPSNVLTGVVLRPDGKPAAGAEVALATPDHPLVFEGGQFRFYHGNGMSFAMTGPDGRFSFVAPGGPYLLAATSDDGYAEATRDVFAKSGALTLMPWGKIRGEARIGRKLAADQIISLISRNRNFWPGRMHGLYDIETHTDARGRFVFDRVIPGPYEVARVVVTEIGNGTSQHMGCWQEPLDVAPGDIVLARIGGKGRPVIGRIKLPDSKVALVDWRRNRPATLSKSRSGDLVRPGAAQDPHWLDRFAASLDKDGRFRIDDVPPGHYKLTRTDPFGRMVG